MVQGIHFEQLGNRAATAGRRLLRLKLIAKYSVRREKLLVGSVVGVLTFEIDHLSIDANDAKVATFVASEVRDFFRFHQEPAFT